MSVGIQHRFKTLDAMRGIAAILVVIFHCDVSFSTVPLAPQAYLAVDLFFALSGFVISHAYDERLRRMGAATFLVERIIRLYPLYVAGTAIAVAFILLRLRFDPPHHLDDPIKANLAAITFFAALLLPYFGTAYLYPLNGPAWSLFYELLVNFLFALFHRALSVSALTAVCIVSAAIFVIETAITGQTGGFWWTGWPAALAGAVYSFTIGVVIHRRRARLEQLPRLSSRVVCMVLCVLLLARFQGDLRAVYDLAFILIASPILVVFGMKAQPSPQDLGATVVLGGLSYPAYTLHLPLMNVFSYLGQRMNVPKPLTGLAFATALSAISLVLLRYYDQPFRRGLRKFVNQ